jgi:glycosyltransferase involved in cell wall biosynthesis
MEFHTRIFEPKGKMKILMIVRPTLYSSPGGDTTQIEMTAKYLRALGVSVDIALADSGKSYDGYDLIHFFNIIRPDDILPHINHDIPFVISTIFVEYTEYEKLSRRGLPGLLFRMVNPGQIEYIKAWGRWVKNGDKIKSPYYMLYGHNRSIRKLIRKAKLLLPNSDSEYQRLSLQFKAKANYQKVVNAIDPEVFKEDIPPNDDFRDHILCVGRIEGRKNQLNLIAALKDTGLRLTIIGKPSPNHLSYYNACQEAASSAGNVHFIEHLDHSELVRIYKSAKVHVLPSWFETTGLSSLEAGVMGCNIVVTRKGDTEEYFQDLAYYCDPADIGSIRQAVLDAYNSPFNPILRETILTQFTWLKTAEQTLAAYKS